MRGSRLDSIWVGLVLPKAAATLVEAGRRCWVNNLRIAEIGGELMDDAQHQLNEMVFPVYVMLRQLGYTRHPDLTG